MFNVKMCEEHKGARVLEIITNFKVKRSVIVFQGCNKNASQNMHRYIDQQSCSQ